jgi:hypothetical protein
MGNSAVLGKNRRASGPTYWSTPICLTPTFRSTPTVLNPLARGSRGYLMVKKSAKGSILTIDHFQAAA